MGLTVVSACSGKVLLVLSLEDFQTERTSGTSLTGRALKLELAARQFGTRFRLRLLHVDSSVEIKDEDALMLPLELKLVMLALCPPDPEEDAQFILACEEGHLEEVEQSLQRPQDPDTTDMGWTGLHLAALNLGTSKSR
ncbi:unnamed protein product [Durusdinium trenchii]|uniref:Uncharacterized protein n=1 Tax=Durusdinium trenchii TaxID=1381693 RepID=A0ABP0PAC3_9DINO